MVVHGRRGQRAVVLVNDLIRLPLFELVAPGPAEMDAAYAAFVAFGKGSGHPASLNFGDVFSYALAKVRGLPLLFKGDDFSQTDIASAVDVMHLVSRGAPKQLNWSFTVVPLLGNLCSSSSTCSGRTVTY